MSNGSYFEDFKVGQVIKHWPGRTISETDNSWFSLLTQNQHPVHIDAHYAKSTQHGQNLVNGLLVLAIAIGQTVNDISLRAIANLDYESVKHEGPTFHGDTIYTTSTILALRVTSKGDRGVVYLETEVTNQREERVMEVRRHVLIPKKNHPTLGEGKIAQDSES
jgi:acyl dehydratase|tara:strand:+ start:594 stop:1085 length:492 start_codon:yes stop_codon:yes gene_type:complete